MKRIILLLTVAAMIAAMMAAAGPAFATIHEVAKMECASENSENSENVSPVVQNQEPPGLTGRSQGSPPNNPTGTNIGQPVFAVTPEDEPIFPGAPPSLVGTNPSSGGASANALKPEGC
jgi:hypothetical protein